MPQVQVDLPVALNKGKDLPAAPPAAQSTSRRRRFFRFLTSTTLPSAAPGARSNNTTAHLRENASTREIVTVVSKTAVSSLQLVGSAAPIPFVQEAAGFVGALLEKFNTMKDNDETVQSLKKEIEKLLEIFSGIDEATVPDKFSERTKRLISDLKELEGPCDRFIKQRWYRQFIFGNPNKDLLVRIGNIIKDYLEKFQLAHHIDVQAHIQEFKILATATLPIEKSQTVVNQDFADTRIFGVDVNSHSMNSPMEVDRTVKIEDSSFKKAHIEGIDGKTTVVNSYSHNANHAHVALDDAFRGAVLDGRKGVLVINHHSSCGNRGT